MKELRMLSASSASIPCAVRGLEEFLVLWRVLDVIEEHRCLLSATARRELGEVGANSGGRALWKP
eukprot:4142610-Prymnesium_polylepis.1